MAWLNPFTWGRNTGGTITPIHRAGVARAGMKPAAAQMAMQPERKDLGKIVADMRGDYQVTFCERILGANINAIAVTASGDGVSEELVEELQNLWSQTLTSMLDAIAYGRVAYELEWSGKSGYQVPSKCEPLPFEQSRMRLCEGHFDGIDVKAVSGEWLEITPTNAWWLAIDATVVQPHGRSRFLDAPYNVFKEKAGAKENRKTAVTKWATRGPIMRGPITEFDEQTQEVYEVLPEMSPAVDGWSKGAMLYLSNARDPASKDGNEFKYVVEQADLGTFDPNALNDTMERLDVEMARAFGIAEQTIMEAGGVGTYGSITQKMLLLFAVCEGILDQWCRSFEKYVIGKTLAVNGLPEDAVTLSYTSLAQRPDAFVFEVVKLLLANPSFVEGILSGGIDLQQMLEDAGLPVTDQLMQAMQAVSQRMAAVAAAGAPLPGAAPTGEMSGLGRRQWQNNIKAIRDVLKDMIAGTTSETMARELLQSLGVPPDRAQIFIDDAKDGTVDDAELSPIGDSSDATSAEVKSMSDFFLGGSVTLAQVPIPKAGFKVPDTAQVLNAGLREFDRLFDEMVNAMAKRASQSTLNGIRKQIVTLEAELRTVGRLLGMLSPWQPRAVTYAGGQVPKETEPLPVTLADNGYKFPWMDDALAFLESKGVVTAEQFAKMAEADRRTVFSAPGINSTKQLKTIQTKLAKSFEAGGDLRTFRKSIEADVALTRAQTETMYRTETKRGYVAGLDKALAAPVVRDEFPAVMFSATSDQRVRDSHWDLDGEVCLRTDPRYKEFLKTVGQYNCRCALIPLSIEDAKKHGLKVAV